VKAALALLGMVEEEIRHPLTPLGAAKRDRLEAVLKEQGIL
jgi:dihydrodipicolinate synthase/N-acetylneuraminate lyase